MPGPEPSTKRTILAACGVTTLGSLPAFLLGAQAVIVMEDLNFQEEGLGVAIGCFFASAAGFTILGGRAADRVGRRMSTVVAGLLAALGSYGLAAHARSWAALVAAMIVLGAANAACQATANLSMARAIPLDRRGLGFGIKQAAVPAAIVLAGLAVPTLTSAFGWRFTFGVAGACGLLVALAGLALRRDPPRRGPTGLGADRPPMRALAVCFVGVVLAASAVNATAAYAPAWAFELGLTPGEAGVLMAMGSAINVAGRIFSGFFADRRDGRNLPIVAIQMVVGSVALWVMSVPASTSLVPAMLIALGIGWSWPGLMLFAVVRVSRDAPGMASAVVQAAAFAGAAAGPVAFGVLVNLTGYPTAWRLAATAALVASGLVLGARRLFLTDLLARPPREPIGHGGSSRRITARD